MRYLLLLSCLAFLLAAPAAIAGEVALLPHVATNDDLKAVKSTAYTTVVRDGFATPGDGGAATYTSSNVACTLNAGAGDNGSQVAAANGGCWLADLAPGFDIRQFGCVLDGVTSCDTALINAVAAAAGGTIVMPGPGKAAITGGSGTIALSKVKFDCRGPLNNTNSAAGQYGKQGGGFSYFLRNQYGGQLYRPAALRARRLNLRRCRIRRCSGGN